MGARAAGAAEVVARPTAGRVFETSRRVRYGDADPQGRLRLDALARYLQDVAGDDTHDADIGSGLVWVVRRTLVEVHRPARAWDRLAIATWCGGTGSHWAERVVTLDGLDPVDGDPASAPCIRTATLWVQVDPASQRPAKVPPSFLELYGSAAAGRSVSSHLQLDPHPPDGAEALAWPMRSVDVDVLDHMNNAVAWSMVEEVVDRAGGVGGSRSRGGMRAEIEFRAPVLRHDEVTLRWQVDPDGVLHAWAMVAGPDAPPDARMVARVGRLPTA